MKDPTKLRSRLFEGERRFVHTVGDVEFVTTGLSQPFWHDLYHHLLALRWAAFFLFVSTAFVITNSFFAVLYSLDPGSIADRSPSGFWGAFFFSVETFATVGYGAMHPGNVFGHVVSTVEILVGMSCTALITGLIFSRFSRPHAKLLFARTPVIRPLDGSQALMMRVANARLNVISEATANLRLMRMEMDDDGEVVRNIYDLKLERDHHPVFVMGWNIVHKIDESSPLFRQTPESLKTSDTQLILSIEGTDDNTDQFMRSRHVYSARQIRWQHRYTNLVNIESNGVHRIDYARFHDVDPV